MTGSPVETLAAEHAAALTRLQLVLDGKEAMAEQVLDVLRVGSRLVAALGGDRWPVVDAGLRMGVSAAAMAAAVGLDVEHLEAGRRQWLIRQAVEGRDWHGERPGAERGRVGHVDGWQGAVDRARRPRPPGRGAAGAGAPRRRWTLRVRDLLSRPIYIVTAVHEPSRTVTVHLRGPAVLEPRDLRRFRRQLDDALAAVIADGGDYG